MRISQVNKKLNERSKYNFAISDFNIKDICVDKPCDGAFLVLDLVENKFNWTNLSETVAPELVVAVQAPELVVDMQHVSAVLTELVLTGYLIKNFEANKYIFIH